MHSPSFPRSLSIFLRRSFAGPLLLALLAAGTSPIRAEVPGLLGHQGRMVVNGVNFTGTGLFKFALVSGTGSVTYWSNDGTSVGGGAPAAALAVPVTNGLYNVLLGESSLNGGSPIPATVFRNSEVRLRIWCSDGLHGWELLAPDQRIVSVGYALMAASAASVVDGAITSAKLARGAVTTEHIADAAVTAAQLAPGSVSSAQIAPGAINASHLSGGLGSQVFLSSGTFVAPPNTSFVFVTLVGGGGGGGAGDQVPDGFGGDNFSGGGGGAGGVVANYPVPVTPGKSYSVTIGTGGAGAPAGAAGGSPPWSGRPGSSGGNTDFGGLVSASGGAGGGGGTGLNEGGGGAGGRGGGTTAFASMGFTGTAGGARGGDNSYVGGAGGGSPFGNGGGGATGPNANGGNASGNGAGGGGGAPSVNNNGRGGNGSPGLAIVRY